MSKTINRQRRDARRRNLAAARKFFTPRHDFPFAIKIEDVPLNKSLHEIPVVEAMLRPNDFSKSTKAELAALATEHDIKVNTWWTKDRIITRLREAGL